MNRRISHILAIFSALLFMTATAYSQNTSVYMLVDGLDGPEQDRSFYLYEFEQSISCPYDPDTYQIIGSRQYSPITIAKLLDSASPVFTEWMVRQTRIDQIEFSFRKLVGHEEVEYYHIQIREVTLVDMTTQQPDTKDPDETSLPHLEYLRMMYQNIVFTDRQTGHDFEDYPYVRPKINTVNAMRGIMYIWDEQGSLIEGPLEEGGYYFYEYSSDIRMPYDISTGRPAGPSLVGLAHVTKELDLFSSLFVEHLSQGTEFSRVQFSFMTLSPTGGQEAFYEITLENAKLVSNTVNVVSATGNNEYLTFNARRWIWHDLVDNNEYSSDEVSGYIATKADNQKGTFRLYSFPNPFNATTQIYFNVPDAFRNQPVNVSIYDTNGRLVRELFNDLTQSEDNVVIWDARNQFGQSLTSGTYFYRVSAGGAAQTGKLLLIK